MALWDANEFSGKRYSTAAALKLRIDTLPPKIFASGMVLHNTALPSLAMRPHGLTVEHVANLKDFFKDVQGWPSGPHAFVDDFGWIEFTKFPIKGTHSPSWNGTKLGVEMLGDFAIEDDDSGRGLIVKKNAAILFAMLHEKYGWNPETIKLHKMDPRTTHECPGNDIELDEFIGLVQEYMGHAGEHIDGPLPLVAVHVAPSARRGHVVNVRPGDVLNVRLSSSASSPAIHRLPPDGVVEILNSAMNGKTRWLRVAVKTTTTELTGWAAAAYIKEG